MFRPPPNSNHRAHGFAKDAGVLHDRGDHAIERTQQEQREEKSCVVRTNGAASLWRSRPVVVVRALPYPHIRTPPSVPAKNAANTRCTNLGSVASTFSFMSGYPHSLKPHTWHFTHPSANSN